MLPSERSAMMALRADIALQRSHQAESSVLLGAQQAEAAMRMTSRHGGRIGAEEHRGHGHAMSGRHDRGQRQMMPLEAPGPGTVAGRIAENHQRIVAVIAKPGIAGELAEDGFEHECAAHLREPARTQQRAEQVPGGRDLTLRSSRAAPRLAGCAAHSASSRAGRSTRRAVRWRRCRSSSCASQARAAPAMSWAACGAAAQDNRESGTARPTAVAEPMTARRLGCLWPWS